MHYKAFNAKTLSYNIHFLSKKKLFRANCIALAHLLSIILSSYFPASLLLLSVSVSWNVISPLISSFLCLLIDMMRQKGPWRFGEDTPWGQRRWQCLTLAKKALNWDFGAFSSSAAKPPTFFVLFPFGTNTRILLYLLKTGWSSSSGSSDLVFVFCMLKSPAQKRASSLCRKAIIANAHQCNTFIFSWDEVSVMMADGESTKNTLRKMRIRTFQLNTRATLLLFCAFLLLGWKKWRHQKFLRSAYNSLGGVLFWNPRESLKGYDF